MNNKHLNTYVQPRLLFEPPNHILLLPWHPNVKSKKTSHEWWYAQLLTFSLVVNPPLLHFFMSVLMDLPSLHCSSRNLGVILEVSPGPASQECNHCSHAGFHTQRGSVLGLMFCYLCIKMLTFFFNKTLQFHFSLSPTMALLLSLTLYIQPVHLLSSLAELTYLDSILTGLPASRFVPPLVCFPHSSQSDVVCVLHVFYIIIYV